MGIFKSIKKVGAASLAVLFLTILAFAAPHDGEKFDLMQPDGSSVPVIVWGDEFYQTIESPDGFTLMRDADGWIVYAELSADGKEFVSTGIRYTGDRGLRSPLAMQRHLRRNVDAAARIHEQNRIRMGFDAEEMQPEDERWRRQVSATTGVALSAPVRNVVGLLVLVNFPAGLDHENVQRPATISNIPHASMVSFVNGTQTASVRQYFLDVSNGLLDYSHIVTAYITLPRTKLFYDRNQSINARTFLDDVLIEVRNEVTAGRLNLSTLSTTGTNNDVVALNVMYAGSPAWGWSMGLWPHMSTYSGSVTIPASANTGNRNLRFRRYQMTSLGTGSSAPGIGTYVHETGHLVMSWNDLYPYDNSINYVRGYCMMSSQNSTNPQTPNPYFRDLAGWINITEVNNDAHRNITLTHEANSHTAFKFTHNTNESFYIEARRRTGRSAALPGEGLIIWHIHRQGDNVRRNPATAPAFTLAKPVQANRTTTNSMEGVSPDANAPFVGPTGNRSSFNSTSTRRAVWHDQTAATINLNTVSAVGNTMTFNLGTGGGAVTTRTVTFNANGGSPTPAMQTVNNNSLVTQPTAPTRSGFTFGGWWTAQTGGTQWNFASDRVTANITLWARWTAVTTYTVTFNANGGTPTPAQQTVNAGGFATQPTAPTRTNFTFAGWFTQETGGTQWIFATSAVNANTTLWARWTPVQRTVTFDANGGTPTPAAQTVNHGSTITQPTAPTRANFTFAGWWSAQTGGTQWNFTTSTVTANITLWARWTAIQHTVTFNVNGGTPAPAAQTVNAGSLVTQPTPPTREGHAFGGWWTQETGGTQWNFATSTVSANITLWARWLEATRNIDLSQPAPTQPGLGWRFENGRYIIENGADVNVFGTNGDNRRLGVDEGAVATIRMNSVVITAVSGGVPLVLGAGANITLVLEGTSSLTAPANRPGIEISGATLTIIGTGSLTATGGSGSAGIGGRPTGDSDRSGEGGTLTISDGVMVTAIGGTDAQGIGRGRGTANAGSFTMNGNAIVYASSIGDNTASRRTGGILFIGNGGNVLGENVALSQNLTITAAQTLTIPLGATLTLGARTLTNSGTINGCGKIVGNVLGIAPQFHTLEFGDWDTTQVATCAEAGARERTISCSVVGCSHSDDEADVLARDPNAHDMEWITIPGSCLRGPFESGNCLLCEHHEETEEGQPLGHDWDESTCEAEKIKYCLRLGCEAEAPCAATSIINVKKSDGKHGIKFAVNPVSDNAEISVVLPHNERAVETKIAIYDMTGNVVFSTTASTASATNWDLRNSAGRFVANGTYLVITETKTASGKIYSYSARLGVKR